MPPPTPESRRCRSILRPRRVGKAVLCVQLRLEFWSKHHVHPVTRKPKLGSRLVLWCHGVQQFLLSRRGILPLSSRNVMNHSQVGQSVSIIARSNGMNSSDLASPNHSSPSIIGMPKQQQQQAKQQLTIKRWTIHVTYLRGSRALPDYSHTSWTSRYSSSKGIKDTQKDAILLSGP